MDQLRRLVDTLESTVWGAGISIGEDVIPFVVILLLGAGVFLTLRLGFIQLRRLGHGFGVTTGRYDDPDEPGDVSHFQALTTALSATVGIGNIAGVALAIHWGGPGALFWMWLTAVLGMATKYTEVTLAQHYRSVELPSDDAPMWSGTVSGGPMYYIERGLGPKWKPMAIFFAVMLGLTAFLTGNGVQANTVADTMRSEFGVAHWISGLVTATVVGLVIIGGIKRIGKVTGILAPIMAGVYVLGALLIIGMNYQQVIPAFGLIFSEAFSPSAGVAGTGVGAFLMTMMYGVQRGLFSNEAGQGSAPIAHAAAKTDEPVSEGVVALLEPFIDTICICTMTALVIIVTGVWDDRIPTQINISAGAVSYVDEGRTGRLGTGNPPPEIEVRQGIPMEVEGYGELAWNNVPVEEFFTDPDMTMPFTGTIVPGRGVAVDTQGREYGALYGGAVETAAPLTMLGFRRGLAPLGDWGHYIVLFAVLLFGVSTAIAWSYYGDRCAFYLFGEKAVLPYKLVFVVMHFIGAVIPLAVAWTLGDFLLGIVIIPNLIAIVLLSPKVAELTKSYFERKPWLENAEVHRRVLEEKRRKTSGERT